MIVSLKKEIEELKGKLTSMPVNNKSSSPSYQFDEILQELGDINAKKSNIIIFDIPEISAHTPREKLTTEMKLS